MMLLLFLVAFWLPTTFIFFTFILLKDFRGKRQDIHLKRITFYCGKFFPTPSLGDFRKVISYITGKWIFHSVYFILSFFFCFCFPEEIVIKKLSKMLI